MASKRFELSFWGTPYTDGWPGGTKIRWRRWHPTFESAEEAAGKALRTMHDRAAHPAIIWGPGCGRDGRTLT